MHHIYFLVANPKVQVSEAEGCAIAGVVAVLTGPEVIEESTSGQLEIALPASWWCSPNASEMMTIGI
jgi:hypothetical protein